MSFTFKFQRHDGVGRASLIRRIGVERLALRASKLLTRIGRFSGLLVSHYIALWAVLFFATGVFAQSLETLKAIKKVQNGTVQSPAEFLQMLPDTFKENILIGYKSRGLGRTSPQFPRLITFTKSTAPTFIAVQTDPSSTRSKTVEMIEWSDKKGEFDFIEIDFSNSKRIVRNPPKCFRCHEDRKPIWDSYPSWPGFFGSAQLSATVRLQNDHEDYETKLLKEFVKNGFNTPIAQSLLWRKLPANSEFLNMVHKENSRLNTVINLVLAKKITDEIEQKDPNFYENRAGALLLKVFGYTNRHTELGIEGYDEKVKKLKASISLGREQYLADTKHRQFNNGIIASSSKEGYMAPDITVMIVSRFKNLAEGLTYLIYELGMEPKKFETTFGKNLSFSTSDGLDGNLQHMWVEIAKRLLQKYPEWAKVFELHSPEAEYAKFTGIQYENLHITGTNHRIGQTFSTQPPELSAEQLQFLANRSLGAVTCLDVITK